MNYYQAVQSGFSNYFNFKGRAPRSEYWYWALFTTLASIVAGVLDAYVFPTTPSGIVEPLFTLATFIPSIAVSIRRLHDIDRTGWWFLLIFTLVGTILLLVWACFKGTAGSNRFGPDPLPAG
jgi:uncharacterized membrane protein YhaH (DUF805 family)